jgi:hypothetical protein
MTVVCHAPPLTRILFSGASNTSSIGQPSARSADACPSQTVFVYPSIEKLNGTLVDPARGRRTMAY